MMRRRDALKLGVGACAASAFGATIRPGAFIADFKPAAIERLSLAPVDVELAPGIIVRTLAFGSVPGPLLRINAAPTNLELRNESGSAAIVESPAFAESPVTIPARTSTRVPLRTSARAVPGMSIKPYRTYAAAGGTIVGGAVVAHTGRDEQTGAFDQLHILPIHRWAPRPEVRAAPFTDTTAGYEYASFNDKLMSASEPIKVRYGDRVRFHFSNGSVRAVTLAMPQHRFLVVALDGHRVPRPCYVDRLYMGPGESIDALVTMNHPGRWILGTTHREDRIAGLGRLVEYAGAGGAPLESEYGIGHWDYAWFSAAEAPAPLPSSSPAMHLSIRSVPSLRLADPQLNPSPRAALPLKVSAGARYQIAATNLTREPQSLQVLNHDVELVSSAGQQVSGVRKDILTVPCFTRIEFGFLARMSNVLLAHSPHAILERAPA